MNDKQLDLIKQIISEQLEDYLAPKLAEDLTGSIMMGIFDNMEIFEKLAEEEQHMDLRSNLKQGEQELRKHLDLDTFGEIMDEFIEKSEVGLLITKEENSKDWKVQGAGCGAVLDFYIFLNAVEPLFLQMLKEMGKHEVDVEKLVEALTGLLKDSMIEAAKEMDGKKKGG